MFGSHHDGLKLLESEVLSWHLIDLPGHGKTPSSASLEDIKNYLDKLQSPFHLVGYSLGGRVAQKLSFHPKCLSLTLISADTDFSDETKKSERVEFEKKLFLELENSDLETFFKNWYNNPLFASLKRRKKLFEKTLLQRSHQNKQELLEGLKKLTLEHLESSLPTIPTLAIYGMFDQKYKKLYGLLQDPIHVVSIPNAGHALHLENPKTLLLTCEKFVRMIES
jgi:2-succinyl-6-hydroxy-2,4-cyclohexadiene-1-carboxylate synthase